MYMLDNGILRPMTCYVYYTLFPTLPQSTTPLHITTPLSQHTTKPVDIRKREQHMYILGRIEEKRDGINLGDSDPSNKGKKANWRV